MSRELKEWFENLPISRVIENELPLDQFEKGNFSQAHKIIDVYQETIQRLRNNFIFGNIGTNNINLYIDAEKKRIEQVFQDIKGIEFQINTIIKEQKKLIKKLEIKYSEKSYGKGLIKVLKENAKSNPKEFKSLIENDFDNNPDNRDKVGGMYYEFVDDEPFVQLLDKQAIIDGKKKDIKNLKKDERHTNIDKYYDRLKRGSIKESIENNAREKIEEFFGKKIGISSFDERDLKTIFLEKIADKLIFSNNTDKKTKLSIIRSYEKKMDLFFYIFNEIYQGKWIWSNSYTYDTPTNINDLRAEWLQRTEEFFVHISDILDYAQRNEVQWTFMDDYVVTKEELTFLKEELQRPNKKFGLPSYIEGDKSIRDIRIKIRRVLDDSNLESEYQSLWNFDFQNIAESKEYVKSLLRDIFDSMTAEEQEQFQCRYGDGGPMQKFTENIKSNRRKIDGQMSIWTNEEMEELNPTPKVEVEVYQKKRKKKK